MHLDGLALVGGNKDVGASGCPVDLGVISQPLVGEGHVVQPVGVFDAGGVGGEGLPNWAVPLMVGAPVARVFGPGTTSRSPPESILPSSVQMAPSAVQSAVTGSTMVAAPSRPA